MSDPGDSDEARAALFGRAADFVVRQYAPQTVLVAGPETDPLLQGLRERGADAGRAAATDEPTRPYDLLVCVDAFDGLSAIARRRAIWNLARHTDRILCLSARVEVDMPGEWVAAFAAEGFVPAMTDVAVRVAPQAIVLERGSFDDAVAVAREYENERYALAVESRGAARHVALLEERLDAIEASTWWRFGAPLRAAVTWLRTLMRSERRRDAPAQPALLATVPAGEATPIEEAAPVEAAGVSATPQALFTETFPDLWALPVHPAPVQRNRRLVLLTERLGPDTVFGGVGTALLLGSLLARRLDVPLLVATRADPPEPDRYADVLRAHGVEPPDDVDFAFARDPISWVAADLVLTTSWSSTWSALRTVLPGNVVYLVQEDERLSYPAGDRRLLCSEVLANREITFVVNSSLLRRQLVEDGFDNLETAGMPFEPAFPRSIFHPGSGADGRKRFLFYATPPNGQSLFVRGVTAIGEAVAGNVLDPTVWELVFVGRDLPPVELGGGIVPSRLEAPSWAEYAAEIRRADLGLALIPALHPSHPALDLAASGAVAVTNGWGAKTSLSTLSENIVTTGLDVDSLVDGIGAGCRLALDVERRAANFERQTLPRDWETAFADLLAWLERRL